MMTEELFWLAFSLCGANSRDLLKLHKVCPDLAKLWCSDSDQTLAGTLNMAKISPEKSLLIIRARKNITPQNIFDKLIKHKIKLLAYTSPDYPWLLKQIHNPPALLYVLGNEKMLTRPMVAIVGSRRCSAYGIKTTRRLAGDLARQDLVIASGLASGIDFVAHTAAIENGGHTVAVAPYGFDMVPGTQRALMYKIREHGAVISEYPPSASALPFTFIERNRIISGLSLGTLVVEAAIKSGALNTAKYAREQNREVFAVPGPVDSITSMGTNELIKRSEAGAITEAKDILLGLSITAKTEENTTLPDMTESEKEIHKLLLTQQLNGDEIIKASHLTDGQILNAISLLEIKGIIKKNINGHFYIIKQN